MRTIISLCAVTILAGGLAMWRAMQLPTAFGSFTGAAEVAAADLIERPADFRGKTVLVSGSVRQQCKAMGCFFSFYAGKKSLRINIEEIAMTAPKKEGHRARVEGQIVPYRDGYQLFASAVEFQ
jgi:hypothetical protein